MNQELLKEYLILKKKLQKLKMYTKDYYIKNKKQKRGDKKNDKTSKK